LQHARHQVTTLALPVLRTLHKLEFTQFDQHSKATSALFLKPNAFLNFFSYERTELRF